ncbi:Alpha-1,2-mannosidase family protein [Tolypocladium paradoxum]|uniref:Alpha-1,2-mannosidase family protein n=1 Tax=Tolypocladium paradoxum TaxID=94208 RepID=A0A2S4L0T2_9HYPO|nr:Alpha-1,2-mannosidase family protein [Tolypocladium paradoxum]
MTTENTTVGESGGDVKIIPLEAKDRWRPVDNIRSKLFFIVREALDGDTMRNALDQLIRDHLPILGASIELTGKGGHMAYHLPNTFSENHKLFQWSHETMESTLESAQLLPTKKSPPSGSAFFAPASVPDMETEWIPSDWPLERKFEKPNMPLLLVHITSYTDATILALSLPHAVTDQMGYASMVSAWLQLIDGQQPAPFLELSPGALDGPQDISREELRRKNRFRITSKAETLAALMGFIPDLIMNPTEVRRTLFLPATLVDDLRKRHNESLKAEYGEDRPTITNGDIIAGILSKFAYLARRSAKTVTLISAINGRGRHPALPAGRAYLHNCITFAITRMPSNTSLSQLAYAHRLAVREGAKLENIERDLAVTRELCRTRSIPYFGEPFELSYSVSNWCGAWRQIDFGPAVAKVGRAAADAKPATAVPLIFGQSRERSSHAPTRYVAHIMCKADGGYWCDFSASTKTMRLVEELLASDPQLQTL